MLKNGAAATVKAGEAIRDKATSIDYGGAFKRAGRAILSNRIATVVTAVVLVLAVGGIVDNLATMGKSYGHVSVNGIDVGGLTKEEIVSKLDDEYTAKATGSQVTVYANQEAMDKGADEIEDAERIAQAEEVSVEEADAAVTSWTRTIYDLNGTLDYESVAEEALKAGRGSGPFGRFATLLLGNDLPFDITFDSASLDAFAAEVDKTVGDPRIDATVAFDESGSAYPVDGHQGVMIDRDSFAKTISSFMLGDQEEKAFVAAPVAAPSRTTFEEAQEACTAINNAIAPGAVFSYEGQSWTAARSELAKWTRVNVVESNGAYEIAASIDEAIAIPAVVKGVNANVTSEDVTVVLNKISDQILVHTSGPGEIPEVAPAVASLGTTLYGEDGTTFAEPGSTPYEFEIVSSNAPGALTFDQAVELGILTVIGEYTTEFSNYEGTENRNHNIRTAADILDGTIAKADGGIWSFNDNSGDTTKDPPFASAGSIIDGEHVDSIGGGICQVATTVFNAAYEAGLPIVERHNHTEHMHSYPDGRDAAVSYGEWDLKWKDDTPSDIVLRLSYTDTSVTARLYSVYTGRTVSFVQGDWIEGETYTTKFEEDAWLSAGQYYTETAGEDGSSISVTRTVLDAAGNVLEEQTMTSVYSAKKEVIIVGPGTDTKPLEHKATPSVSEETTSDSEESETL